MRYTKKGVLKNIDLAVGYIYASRMHSSYDDFPEGWPERFHKVEAELVKLRDELKREIQS